MSEALRDRYARLASARHSGKRGEPDPNIMARMLRLRQPAPEGEGLTPNEAVARFGMGSLALRKLHDLLNEDAGGDVPPARPR